MHRVRELLSTRQIDHSAIRAAVRHGMMGGLPGHINGRMFGHMGGCGQILSIYRSHPRVKH